MANKIQLRRDTTANWNNVNPILADGEPGLDITENKVKYGDGANVWANLSYASGGGSASTGDVTFSGINIIGDDNLRLQPNVSATDGYVDIYLTTGPDIHIDNNSGNLILGSDNWANVRLATDGNVQIRSQDINSTSTWTFNSDGNITFPDSTTQSTAFNITNFGEGFSLTAADTIVTNKLYSTNASSPTQHYRLELDTNGVVVLPDQSIINGSTIRGVYGTGGLNYSGITIGPNVSYQEESWMYVDHTGAYIATKYNTDQKLWQFDNTGNLTLTAGGEIHSSAGTGNVSIQTNDGNNTYNWTFETNGNLTFPDSTTQSTAYKRTTSSWNVAVGSATYNFTVPLNGTYSMWVKGAIDNGIIVWNATGTVTNSNVPVVGQQYTWNYTGGGTPIEITAIPTQFVGTGNVIVSSNPSVGSNSNVFNFTINNTSGSAKTVYWGYVAQ